MALPFLVAAAFPFVLFSIYYWHRSALHALMNGLFVAPFRRLLSARLDPPGLLFEYPSVLAALFVAETASLRGQPRRVLSIILCALAALVLLGARRNDLAYLIGITSVLGIIPVLVVATILAGYFRKTSPATDIPGDQFLFLLLAMAALCSLIQFPYSSLGYFFYVAPFAVLLAARLISQLSRPPRVVLYATAAFYILFANFVTRPHYIGTIYHPAPEDTQLTFPRAGGIWVSRALASEYDELISFVKNVAGDKPIPVAKPSIAEFRDASWTRLSERALNGFITRAAAGGLRMPGGFLDALRRAARRDTGRQESSASSEIVRSKAPSPN